MSRQRTSMLCRHRGCNAIHRNSHGYCDAHEQQKTGWLRKPKGSSTERGYGSAWRKLRDQILRRDLYLCQVCKREGRLTEATEVDHIANKSEGGTDEPQNLQAICPPCHKAKTAVEAQRGRRGAG